MSQAAPTREHATVKMADIDPPTLDARIDRDPDKLEELARDILRRGLIEPIKLVRVGDRLEVVDGFRRYLASKSAGLTEVECFIYPTKEVALEGVKYAANAFREDMSPADEAVYFHQLLTHECENDIERVCVLVNKRLSYVDARLALLGGDELVFEALRGRKITIGVANEINKVTAADYRRYYLEHAISGGATVATVSGWVTQWKNLFGGSQPAVPPVEAMSAIVPGPSYDPHRCYICDKNDPRFIPETISVHTHCKLATLDPLLDAARGSAPSTD